MVSVKHKEVVHRSYTIEVDQGTMNRLIEAVRVASVMPGSPGLMHDLQQLHLILKPYQGMPNEEKT